MRPLVLDASVAVKWVIREEHSDNATRLLTEDIHLFAPGHWLAEASTAVWARSTVSKLLSREQAEERIAWLRAVPVRETPVRDLIREATAMSFDLHATFHDSLYLALARETGGPVVTADRRLFDKASGHRHLSSLVRWVGDL